MRFCAPSILFLYIICMIDFVFWIVYNSILSFYVF